MHNGRGPAIMKCFAYTANICIDNCVFLVLGSLHISAILGSILSVGKSIKDTVPAFLKFQIAAGDRSCFIFSNQDGLFVISCSMAALLQITPKIRIMPYVAAGSM